MAQLKSSCKTLQTRLQFIHVGCMNAESCSLTPTDTLLFIKTLKQYLLLYTKRTLTRLWKWLSGLFLVFALCCTRFMEQTNIYHESVHVTARSTLYLLSSYLCMWMNWSRFHSIIYSNTHAQVLCALLLLLVWSESGWYTIEQLSKAHLLMLVWWRFLCHRKLAKNRHNSCMKLCTTPKLSGGSDYDASLLHML